MRSCSRILVFTLLFALPGWHKAFAIDGLSLIGIGPIQQANTGSGAASPQDATWMLLNPAGIVDLDDRFDTFLHVFDPTRRFKPRGFPLVANPFAGRMSDSSAEFVPGMGAAVDFWRGKLAIGMYGVGGTSVEYQRPRSTLALLQNSDRTLKTQFLKVPVVYARPIGKGWSLGFGLHLNFHRLKSDSLTLQLRPTKGDNGWDEALGYGFQVGVYKKWDKVSFGAAYTSRQFIDDYDKYSDFITSNLDFPQWVQIGVAYRPIPKLELLADYKYLNWEQISIIKKPTVGNGLGWDDQHIVKLGFHYDAAKTWRIHGGASYGNPPTTEEDVFSNALSPPLSRVHAALGFTKTRKNGNAFHFTVAHSFREAVTDSGNGDIFSRLGKGSESTMDITSFIVGYSIKLKIERKELPAPPV